MFLLLLFIKEDNTVLTIKKKFDWDEIGYLKKKIGIFANIIAVPRIRVVVFLTSYRFFPLLLVVCKKS